MLAALKHPNIAQVVGVETGDELPIIAMEFVEGPTLADRLQGEPCQSLTRWRSRRKSVTVCVLYEMLTGTRTFSGAMTTDVLLAAVQQPPDWARLPPALPRRITEVLAAHFLRQFPRRSTVGKLSLSPPSLIFVVATRIALAFGAGLLVADRIPVRRRRAIAATLISLGVATTIPAAKLVFGSGATQNPEP